MLKVVGISAYHFYKLIEVAIKLERDFPRGIIKHLNRVWLPWRRICGCGHVLNAVYVGGGDGAESAGLVC